jgi:hypothetical protein
MMGLKPSSYLATKALHFAFEIVTGDRMDPENLFHWTMVIVNLPGQHDYNPTKPQVWKLNPLTGGMTAATLIYDFLGGVLEGDAPHSNSPGAGTVSWSRDGDICVRSTNEKWKEARSLVSKMQQELADYHTGVQPEVLNFRQLESARGFLVHN